MPMYDGNSWETNISATTSYATAYPYLNNGNVLSHCNHGAAVYYGQVYVNDDDTNVTGAYAGHNDTKNFRLFCAVPCGPVMLGGFGRRENYGFGGSYWLEAAVFTKVNTVTARNRIRSYLYSKWFGAESPSTVYERLSVRNNGRLTLVKADATGGYAVTALAGCGTIAANAAITGVTTLTLAGVLNVTNDLSLAGVTALPIAFRSADDYDCLSVGGTLTLPETCTVTVTSDVKRLPNGNYPLLTAKALSGDIANWTLDGSALARNFVTLKKDDTSVILCVAGHGLEIFLR